MQPADRAAAALFRQLRVTPNLILLPTLKGTGAGAVGTAQLPIGLTYHAIHLRCTIAGVPATAAEMVAQVEQVRLILNADPKIDVSGAELAMLDRHSLRAKIGTDPVTAGVLTIWLARPWWQEIDGQDGPAWGTADQNSLTLTVKLAAGATIDDVEARAWVTKPEPLGRHICIRRVTDSVAGAGDKTFSDFMNPNVEFQLAALHIDQSGGHGNTITTLTLKCDQVEEWDGHYDFLRHLQTAYGLYQETGWTHLNFAMRGRALDSLPLVMNDMRLRAKFAGAVANLNILMERIEGQVAAG